MRLVVIVTLMCLAGCASDKLAQSPPAGVDFSGHWKLNEADSDDPQRLIEAQFNTTTNSQNTTTQGGSGGRGGRQGGRGGAGGAYPGGPVGPSMPSITAMGDAVRWPGRQLDVKQVAAVVAFTSEGINRVCQPSEGGRGHHHHGGGPDDRDGPGGRDAAPRARDVPPPHCGWEEKTLIVRGGDVDDERPPFEEHYSLSDDGTRLIGEIEFKGGRSNGFVMSRVWDRLPQ
jgi:hypothetical protein